MIRAPECVDALEARIASNVEYRVEVLSDFRTIHYIRSKSFTFTGIGSTAEKAVTSFLKSNFLE